jgi:hypothetical protein
VVGDEFTTNLHLAATLRMLGYEPIRLHGVGHLYLQNTFHEKSRVPLLLAETLMGNHAK